MSIFAVVWNLNKEGAAYAAAREKFFGLLHQTDYNYSATLETTAFVSSSATARELYDFFMRAMDETDRLLVTRMELGFYMGFVDVEQVAWINARS
jgi:hypothetical protein